MSQLPYNYPVADICRFGSAGIVKWVTKSMRPFSIVEDEGFNVLMKTGRPNDYIPLQQMVARNIKYVFQDT